MISLRRILQSTADVLMPRTCSVCHGVLSCDEHFLCRQCLAEMPLTRYNGGRFSDMDQRFAGKVLIQRTYGYYYYRKGDHYCNIIHDIKYRNLPKMGEWMGSLAATEASRWHFFDGIDVIIPVPMHSDKLAKRGYNQAEWIARGISRVSGIPVKHNITAMKAHSTQTHKHRSERWTAAENIYAINNADELRGKHILLVDDVVTTGATLSNCAKCLMDIPGAYVSVITLAVADNEF